MLKKISFDVLKQPSEVKRRKLKLIVISMLFGMIFDLLAFSLKGVEYAMSKNIYWLAIGLLVVYFGERVIHNVYSTWYEYQEDSFRELETDHSILIVLAICQVVRGKILKEENGAKVVMPHAELLEKVRNYQQSVWELWWMLPAIAVRICFTFVMICLTIYTEWKANSKQACIVSIFFLASLFIYGVLCRMRIKVRKNYRKVRIELMAETDTLYSEIKMNSFISDKDFQYHAERFRQKQGERIQKSKAENLKLNWVFIGRALIASAFMIIITLYKANSQDSFSMETIIDVIATSTIFSTILGQVTTIFENIETAFDKKLDIDTLYPMFDEVMKLYNKEKRRNSQRGIEYVKVPVFTATQDPSKQYQLISQNEFDLNAGDTVLVYGPTGCGKSTFLSLLTGQLRQDESPIEFSNGEQGYLNALSYETDNGIFVNNVINEIILNDDISQANFDKIYELLVGVGLYDEICHKVGEEIPDDKLHVKVFQYLCTHMTNEFSSGQKQRMALVKLLYNLEEDIQLVALDECFNRLDDKTAISTAKFVQEYVQKDRSRILLFATHQVDLVRGNCNREIAFTQDGNTSYLEVK